MASRHRSRLSGRERHVEATAYFVNFDIKKFYLETNVTPQGGAKIETITLNPLLIGLAVGKQF